MNEDVPPIISTILIVEDDINMRNFYQVLLEDAGFQIAAAESYAQAINRMDSSIDLALLDVMLKEGSGLDVLDYNRQHFPMCPAIMISAFADKDNAIAALRAGAVDFLEKPVDPFELIHTVRHWLDFTALKHKGLRLQDYKNMYEALSKSSERLAGILESVAEAVVSINESQHIILFNKGAENIFGYRQEEILGGSLDLLIPELSRALHTSEVANFASAPEQIRHRGMRGKISGRRKNGETFPAEATVSKVKINGKVICTAVIFDITEREHSGLALQEQMQKLRKFNKMAVGREIRMVELKREMNGLLKELGREEKYGAK